MNTQTIIGFTVVATLAILSPGPAVILSLRNGVTLGVRAVMWSALGNVSGVFCLSTAAILGLGVILKSSVVVFEMVKALGAGYLIYLGIRHLLGRATVIQTESIMEGTNQAPPPRQLYREGFLIAGTNPKAVLFFTALFPQYIDSKVAIAPQFFILTGIFMTISYTSHLGYALVAGRAKKLLLRPRFANWLDRVIGTAFITFGSMLLALRRRTV